MRKSLLAVPALVAGLGVAASAAHAALVKIDLSRQTMHVSSQAGEYDWPISSARNGYVTPRGTYGVQRLEAMHYSRKYHHSPMPHSIFFSGGYAIHGTVSTASLGTPASHGCVRIAPGNAALLYRIVRNEGARISITGASSGGTRVARAERRRGREPAYADAGSRAPARPLAYAPQDIDPRVAPGLGDWLRAPANTGWRQADPVDQGDD